MTNSRTKTLLFFLLMTLSNAVLTFCLFSVTLIHSLKEKVGFGLFAPFICGFTALYLWFFYD